MRNRFSLLMVLVVLCLTGSLLGADSDMVLAKAATSKFSALPGLPACMTVAVQRGDPTKESAALLLKFTARCTVPWHWHTAAEQLLLVSGKGTAQMKDGKPAAMSSGDYAFLPSKMVHQFTAVTPVLMLDIPDAAFDIHYVDKAGTEIPPDQVLKAGAKKAAAAKPDKKQ